MGTGTLLSVDTGNRTSPTASPRAMFTMAWMMRILAALADVVSSGSQLWSSCHLPFRSVRANSTRRASANWCEQAGMIRRRRMWVLSRPMLAGTAPLWPTFAQGTGLMAPTRPSFSSLIPALNSSVPVPPVVAVPNFSAHRSSIWTGLPP